MTSIIKGYEYDIFISYRQNDNRSGWVTEFVAALQDELAATIKDSVSVYFDTNPNDGLLETHLIDKSLENKLKCLIFIPVISQTYCDPKSFAWQKEFIAFNKACHNDSIGGTIKLSNGNVSGRMLPVKIHDLDMADKSLLETELGGPIRAVEFIFRSAGVNRPLKPDDSRTENLNHTYYRDQINKVANAVKEIIAALKFLDGADNDHSDRKLDPESISVNKGSKKTKLKMVIWSLVILVLVFSGYLLLPLLSKTSIDNSDKSIAVLPFVNMSNDHDQDYFGNGIMQEILNHLFKIGGLQISSSTSSMRYINSKLPVKEIARELNVSYVLEGNVSKSGENVRVIVRLVNGKDERLIWTEDYKRELTAVNLLEIQSDVAQQVVENMKVYINPEVRNRILAKPTTNTEAYNLFLQAKYVDLDEVKPLVEKAIMLDPGFGEAYARLAFYWMLRGGYYGDLEREQVLEKAEPLIEKALQLDINSAFSHAIYATLRLWFYWDFATFEKEKRTFMRIAPSNSDDWFINDYLLASGRFKEAYKVMKQDFDHDSLDPANISYMAIAFYYNEKPELAVRTLDNGLRLYPENRYLVDGAIALNDYAKNYKRTLEIFENIYHVYQVQDFNPYTLGFVGIAYYKTGDRSKSALFLNELIAKGRNSPVGSPSFYAAATYAVMGEKEKAIQSLEKGFNHREVEMYLLKVEPSFQSLHGDPRFENILKKIGYN